MTSPDANKGAICA